MRNIARSIAEGIIDELGEVHGLELKREEWAAISDEITKMLSLPPSDEEIEFLIQERIKWKVVGEDDDEKRLEAVVGKFQLDWEIDYVNGQSTVAISEDMSQRPDE